MEALIAILCLSLLVVCNCNVDITILHTNDVSSHFEEIVAFTGERYGGVARRKTKIDELRNRADLNNVILLDSGNQFVGTLWFYKYAGIAASHFMNELQYDAMSVGTQELYDIHALGEFADNVDFQVLNSNMNVSAEPRLKGSVVPSVVINKGDVRVGVIGYLTPDATLVLHPDNVKNVEFHDILDSVQREVTRLEADGINIIIACGHTNLDEDIEIAKLDGIDVVVAGYTDTFLYTGTPPSTEQADHPYPYLVTKDSGGKALIVSAHDVGKYLGFLKVEFDDSGAVLEGSGNPIYLDETVVQDADILSQLVEWKKPLDDLKTEVVGYTNVKLEGFLSCFQSECNAGNLITDALVYYYTMMFGAPGEAWTQTSVAVWNSGGIRKTLHKGNVSVGNILELVPFGNTIDRLEITGATLKKVLEHSASDRGPEEGGFLQYSGIKVRYDRNKAEGSRVVQAEVLCRDCVVPEYNELDPNAHYFILAPNFLLQGGDGYTMLAEELISKTSYDHLDSTILTEYLQQRSPVTQGVDGRIRFVEQAVEPTDPTIDGDKCDSSSTVASLAVISISPILSLLIV